MADEQNRNRGASVREMLAQRSTEKAMANLDREDAREREEERKRIQEQAEHSNHCGWGEEVGRWPLFEIDEHRNVFCTHDGRPVTDSHRTLAEEFYWMEVGWGPSPGLVHDEQAQAFQTQSGEPALSRDSVNLEHLIRNETGVGFELH